MKVRVMKRYTYGHSNPFYEVDTWVRLLGPIGYWKTQTRTTDFDYATGVFNDYKYNRLSPNPPKDVAVLIHYE